MNGMQSKPVHLGTAGKAYALSIDALQTKLAFRYKWHGHIKIGKQGVAVKLALNPDRILNLGAKINQLQDLRELIAGRV